MDDLIDLKPHQDQPVKKQDNGAATASMILGIICLVIGIIPIVQIIAIPGVLVGISLGIVGIYRSSKGAPKKGHAITGLILNVAAVLIMVAFWLYVIFTVRQEIQQIERDLELDQNEMERLFEELENDTI